MKLAEFVYLINSFNPIDFEKKSNEQYRKSSHFKLKTFISCLRNKVFIFVQISVKLTQFVYLIDSFNPIDFEKKNDKQYGKSSHFKFKISISCLRDKVCIFGQISMKLVEFI